MDSPEHEKKADVRRPMNAFLIFCKRHRSMVREKNPDLDNRSVTRILGDLWANLGDTEKSVYTSLAKQYKDAFMKANPDYKWHNPDKTHQTPTKMTTRPTNARVVKSVQEIHLHGSIMPGKLADPSKMGGLSLLLMAGQQSMTPRQTGEAERRVTSPDSKCPSKSALLELAEMCANELQQGEVTVPHAKKLITKTESGKKVRVVHKKQALGGEGELTSGKSRSKSESDSNTEAAGSLGLPWKSEQSLSDILKILQSMKDHEMKKKACKEVTGSEFVKQEPENSGKVDACGVADKPLPVEAVETRIPERPGQRARSWSESAKDQDVFVAGMGDHSSYTSVRSKDDTPERRKSQAETLAGCLSDQNDNDIVSCGKLVVDHIFDRLSSTELSRSAVKLKGLTSLDEVRKVLLGAEFGESKLPAEEENPDKKVAQSRIDRLVTEAYPKEKCATETKEKEEVKKEYSPILRVPDFKSFLETEANQKRSSSDAVVSDVVRTKKRMMTLPLEEVKPEPIEDVRGTTPESRADKSDQDCYGGLDEDGKDREDGNYQPVRKSRRRNRGQRYLELINEGIIQPSKERLAARLAEQTSTDDETMWLYEDFSLEDEVQEVRRPATKRCSSDSDANLEEKKYKTGDFDLEAQIATLPACSLDPVSRGSRQKNTPTKIRHHSEGSTKKATIVSSPTTAISDVTTLTLPPHLKMQQVPVQAVPVSGSRKRKARKHSINHLLPASASQSVPPGENFTTNTTLIKDEEGERSVDSSQSVDRDDGSQGERGHVSHDSTDQSDPSLEPQIKEVEQGEEEVKKDASGCETSQSAGSSCAQPAESDQSDTSRHSQEKGCDKNANISMNESDVLDFRTSENVPGVGSTEVCSESSATMKSQTRDTCAIQSNTSGKLMQSVGEENLGDSVTTQDTEGPIRNSESVDSESICPDKVLDSSVQSKATGIHSQEDEEWSDRVASVEALTDGSVCEGSSDVDKPSPSATTLVSTFHSNTQNPLPQESDIIRSDSYSTPSSSVNIVTFSSAPAPSTVDLVTLSTSAVTQGVNLEVLTERPEDSPTSSIAQSPLAAGSPSVGVVHS
ncbi:HMG box transcription factor BBX-like isoform X2 [Haliotis rubra]|uniref:HMG box transcription factor BBX-like isoform X2 n=1 Tax=Haliotis rubra TaxID=36100 RepID=UPI001EE5B396|nr:HMG box transcription factor BBX-like isoform X2 [Haliotis rubra]